MSMSWSNRLYPYIAICNTNIWWWWMDGEAISQQRVQCTRQLRRACSHLIPRARYPTTRTVRLLAIGTHTLRGLGEGAPRSRHSHPIMRPGHVGMLVMPSWHQHRQGLDQDANEAPGAGEQVCERAVMENIGVTTFMARIISLASSSCYSTRIKLVNWHF